MTEDAVPLQSGSLGKRRALVLASLVAALAVLITAPLLYWRVVNSLPERSIPLPPPPSPNGYDVACRILYWAERRAELPENPERTRPPELFALERKLGPRLEELRSAFRHEWNVASAHADPHETSSGRLDVLAKLFVLESRAAAARGERTRAFSCCVDALELGSLACRGGAVRHRYDGQSCAAMGVAEIERMYSQLPLVGLEAQVQRIRRIRTRWPTLAETLDTECILSLRRCRGFLLSLAATSVKDQLDWLAGSEGLAVIRGSPKAPSGEAWQYLLTSKAAALGEIERYYQELSAASSKPAPQGVTVPSVSNRWAKPYCDSSFSGRYRGEWPRNNLALVETALAVRLHFLQEGRYPRSLKDVSPKLLPQVPVDVWGQPVAYRLNAGKPVVYSLGCDGVDDRGRAVDPSSLIRGGKGDVVFGRLSASHWQRRGTR